MIESHYNIGIILAQFCRKKKQIIRCVLNITPPFIKLNKNIYFNKHNEELALLFIHVRHLQLLSRSNVMDINSTMNYDI